MGASRAALSFRVANAIRWRWRVAETIVALVAARFLIRFLPFGHWRSALGPIGAAGGGSAPVALDETQRRLVRAVARDIARWSQRLPFDLVCLPQAMAARWILRRRGIDGRISIGARSGAAQKPLDLHAWLMVGDLCVTGDSERRSFESFAQRPSASR